jgi:hypothetical protein
MEVERYLKSKTLMMPRGPGEVGTSKRKPSVYDFTDLSC